MWWIVSLISGGFIIYIFSIGIFHSLLQKTGIFGLAKAWDSGFALMLSIIWPITMIILGLCLFIGVVYRFGRGMFFLLTKSEDKWKAT